MPLLSWALREQGVTRSLTAEWADLRILRRPPSSLKSRIEAALNLYECDLLFVHRDAENATVDDRRREIRTALDAARTTVPTVCVVPRRMVEAWLLFDEGVIRSASGNPKGSVRLDLPATIRLEDVVDPKSVLHNLLRTASEYQGRRLRSLHVRGLTHRVSELLEEFHKLRVLPAFVAFERELSDVVAQNEWRNVRNTF
jgi:hypothetical protein